MIRTRRSPAKVTPSPVRHSRDEFIDVLRGLAIFSVLLLHSRGAADINNAFRWGAGLFPDFDVSLTAKLLIPADFGWVGVPIFFAISGFCIHNSYTREPNRDVIPYLIKRTFRIYPPYIVSLVIFSLWFFARDGVDPKNVAVHVLLIHNLTNTYFWLINGVYWSLAVEFQLYILYIPLIIGIDKFGWRPIMVLVFCIEVGIRTAEAYYTMRYGEVPKRVVGVPLGYIFSWSVGALVAEWCKTVDKRHFVNRWHIIALISGAVASAFFKPLDSFSFMLFSLSAAAMILYVHENNIQIKRWMGGLLSLGIVSYSVYLIHVPILSLVPEMYRCANIKPHPLVVFVTCVCMVIPLFWCAQIMRKFVELPSVNMGHWLLAIWTQFGRRTQTLPR